MLVAAVVWFALIAPTGEAATKHKPVVVKHFSGNGGKTLAPFRLAKNSTLRWTAQGGLFSIFDSIDKLGSPNAGVPVNSTGSHGSTFLKKGRHSFEINAVGPWTITITA
jgi:hypothetical protein